MRMRCSSSNLFADPRKIGLTPGTLGFGHDRAEPIEKSRDRVHDKSLTWVMTFAVTLSLPSAASGDAAVSPTLASVAA